MLTGAVACGYGAGSSPGEQTPQALYGDKVSLTVPDGWSAESFTNERGMHVLRAGSFVFPNSSSDDIGQVARAAMGPNDVLVNVVDVTATDPLDRHGGYEQVTPPLRIRAADAAPQEGYPVPAAVIRSVTIDGRNLYLSVSFGSSPPSAEQLKEANAVLRSLRVP